VDRIDWRVALKFGAETAPPSRQPVHTDFLDDHNRPTTTPWHKSDYASGGTGPRFVDFQVVYDQVNNQRYVQDRVLSSSSTSTMVRSFDRSPGYDSLRRVTSLDEGELNTGKTAIASRSR